MKTLDLFLFTGMYKVSLKISARIALLLIQDGSGMKEKVFIKKDANVRVHKLDAWLEPTLPFHYGYD